jgi:hypothetical protein
VIALRVKELRIKLKIKLIFKNNLNLHDPRSTLAGDL